MSLKLWSEPYAASGNVSAEGASRTLKATHLDPLSLMVREAVQNSNDAGFNAGARRITFRIAYQIPTDEQRDVLRTRVFGNEPQGLVRGGRPGLHKLLEDRSTGLLLVSDHGTTGLGGPTRADIEPEQGERTDFVNFLRNIGAPQDTQTGGGTYGFGKAAIFNVSRARTVLVHTLCRSQAGPQSRAMAAALGHEFSSEGRRFTGRHWWGLDGNLVAEPARDHDADELAALVGFPARRAGDYGTTVAIVAPEFEAWDQPETALERILTAILVWCWPKMLEPGRPGHPVIDFRLAWAGQDVPVPDPREVPVLRPFADALGAIDAVERAAVPSRAVKRWAVRLERPQLELGTVALKPIAAQLPPDGGLPRGGVDHGNWPFSRWSQGRAGMVVRMRRARLVVDYLDVHAADGSGLDFAAVFLPSNAEEVDSALAASEPPSHDDWNVDQVSSDRGRRIVRGVKRGIDQHVKEFLSTATPGPVAPGTRPSLGRLADSLARLLPGLSGPRIGGNTAGGSVGGGGAGGGGRTLRIEYEAPILRLMPEGRVLEIAFQTKLPPGASALLEAKMVAELDQPGGAAERDRPAGAAPPEVLGWHSDDDDVDYPGDLQLEVGGGNRSWRCRVLLPSEEAVWRVEFKRVAGS